MPSLTTPRSFAFLMVTPLGSVVPTSATGTLSPASKFCAPHTICSGSPAPTSTVVTHSLSASGWRSLVTIWPTTTPSTAPRRCVCTASTSVPVRSSRSTSSVDGQIDIDEFT